MRLTLIPYNCKRGCSFCYLKEEEENSSKFLASLNYLTSLGLFNKKTLFFNTPGCPADVAWARKLLTGQVPVDDIYIDVADFKDHKQLIHKLGYYPDLAVSKFDMEDFELFSDLQLYPGAVTLVHLMNNEEAVHQTLKNVKKLSNAFNHYLLFQKPYNAKEKVAHVAIINNFMMNNMKYNITTDQCVPLALKTITIDEEEGIEGRVDLHPDGSISFCPYFGKHYHDVTNLSVDKLKALSCICNKCPYLTKKEAANGQKDTRLADVSRNNS